MTISAVQTLFSSSASNASGTADASKATGDFDAFLQLLVTQIKNQDPTKPLDPTQTVTQLATFASVEQAVKTNALLGQMADSSTLSQASSLIGRTASSPDGSVNGVITSVTMTDFGLVANLENGGSLVVGPGVSIS
ncbi:flagellar hook assembly protein FlgD [Methylocystis sp. JAN1]|uniref:flagellar hook assembly protein FlgD n=1 Tax=Methylocystis sp. JAN1 TaxID=3397211 RepID=UPI003FA28289